MVRWNAALALVRFGDAAGEPQLCSMLKPFTLVAAESGVLKFRMKERDSVRNGSIMARIRPAGSDVQKDVVSPVGGTIERLTAKDGATVQAGDALAVIDPDEGQVMEALRGLYMVGQPRDLGDVERFAHGTANMPDRVRQQAEATARAIRQRSGGKG
jgi:multidrug efflux pump subunit AcrA (membrane-fusion protein)